MGYVPWSELTKFLLENPEIADLKVRYHKLTGKHLPGWN